MTNDEKAKAYEMALEAARKELGVDRKEWKVIEDVLRNIFPELAESEDERVIRTLFFLCRDHDWLNGATKEECLNWLEKQKESLHISETCKENADSFTSEQKEQKPVVTHGETYHVDTLGTQQVIAGKMPQKPAWSDVDEKMLKCCLIAINHYEKTCNIGDHLPTKFNIDGYLASIDKVKSWLKDLRPSWKPSEEQMNALDFAVTYLFSTKQNPTYLRDLYNDLKKLKED